MKNNSKFQTTVKTGYAISDLVITKDEKMVDQLLPVSREVDEMLSEGGENFLNYVKSVGLSAERKLLVLPATRHFYYEKNDLTGIRTLVNLKSLNTIDHLDSFLGNLVSMLPAGSNFVGCFSDNRNRKGNNGHRFSYLSMLKQKLINFVDSRKVNFMNRNEVFHLLEKNGFNIIDMTNIGGLTYFYSQNAPDVKSLKASLKADNRKN